MNSSQNFSPRSYLKNAAKTRFKLRLYSFLGISGFAVILLSFLSTTSYVQYLTASVSEASAPTMKYFKRTSEQQMSQSDEELSYPEDTSEAWGVDSFEENGCNVLGLTLIGEIGTYTGETPADYFHSIFDLYKGDERVKAILVEVDSGGGSPVGGDEIRELLDAQEVPVVAQIRELGASAAYLSVLSADRIFAHRYGSIGSIGVIISQYDYSQKNIKDGIKYDPIMTGIHKDMGTYDRPLTEEERAIFMQEIEYIKSGFVADVAKYRHLSVEQVLALADGKTYMAPKAKELGLIDEIGSRTEVNNYLRDTLNEEPVICWE